MDMYSIGMTVLGILFLALVAWFMYSTPVDEDEED